MTNQFFERWKSLASYLRDTCNNIIKSETYIFQVQQELEPLGQILKAPLQFNSLTLEQREALQEFHKFRESEIIEIIVGRALINGPYQQPINTATTDVHEAARETIRQGIGIESVPDLNVSVEDTHSQNHPEPIPQTTQLAEPEVFSLKCEYTPGRGGKSTTYSRGALYKVLLENPDGLGSKKRDELIRRELGWRSKQVEKKNFTTLCVNDEYIDVVVRKPQYVRLTKEGVKFATQYLKDLEEKWKFNPELPLILQPVVPAEEINPTSLILDQSCKWKNAIDLALNKRASYLYGYFYEVLRRLTWENTINALPTAMSAKQIRDKGAEMFPVEIKEYLVKKNTNHDPRTMNQKSIRTELKKLVNVGLVEQVTKTVSGRTPLFKAVKPNELWDETWNELVRDYCTNVSRTYQKELKKKKKSMTSEQLKVLAERNKKRQATIKANKAKTKVNSQL